MINQVGLSSTGGGDKGAVFDEEDVNRRPDYSHEWLLVAAAVDRLAMIGFTAIYILALFILISPVH